MNANDYQRDAMRTANTDLEPPMILAVAGLGLTGEAGEVADIIKKHVGHGRPLDQSRLADELGDVLWYVARICHSLECPMSVIMERNIAKLRARWPEGFVPGSVAAGGDTALESQR